MVTGNMEFMHDRVPSGPEASFPGITRQSDQIREPERPRTLLQSTEYSADSGNRTLQASVSLRIHKPKPRATVENNIRKFHKRFDVYTTIQKNNDGGRAVANA